MGFYRKGHPEAGLTWDEAVREALCWGWIDSMAQGIDEHTRRQRWTPRKPGSNWSTININAVAELTAQGRMQPSGLAAFERRREDRSGVYAYENRDRRARRRRTPPRSPPTPPPPPSGRWRRRPTASS